MKIAERIAWVGNKFLSILAALLILLLFSYGAYSLWDIYRINNNAFVSDELLRYKPNGTDNLGFDELRKLNQDVKAWITINDTHIDYPIVKGKDDMEYINKDVFGEFALSGSIFLSSHNKEDFSDSYNMTYGHHMENGAMYGDLSKMMDKKFLKEHQKGTLYLPDKTYEIDLYATLECHAYESRVYGIASIQNHMDSFQSFVKENAKAYLDIGIQPSDKVIALSTCMSATTNGRIVVFGVLKETEKEAS